PSGHTPPLPRRARMATRVAGVSCSRRLTPVGPCPALHRANPRTTKAASGFPGGLRNRRIDECLRRPSVDPPGSRASRRGERTGQWTDRCDGQTSCWYPTFLSRASRHTTTRPACVTGATGWRDELGRERDTSVPQCYTLYVASTSRATKSFGLPVDF